MSDILDWEQVPGAPAPPPTPIPAPYDEDSIFPPSSHEGLRIDDAAPEPPRLQTAAGDPVGARRLEVSRLGPAKRWLLLGFEIVHSKLVLLLHANALGLLGGWVVWPFSAAGVVGGLLLLWLRRRRLALAKREETVLLLIQDVNKKIDHLLLQIAQLKMQSTRYQVPILRNA